MKCINCRYFISCKQADEKVTECKRFLDKQTRKAVRDVAYCANEKCSKRMTCWRNLDLYQEKSGDYWFANFNEYECNEGKI